MVDAVNDFSGLRAPDNTAAEAREYPIIPLAEAIAGGSVAALVDAQRGRGQEQFANSDTLPVQMLGENTRAMLEAAGVRFLGPVEGDKLFQYVELPSGWRKSATAGSLYTDLLDDKGRKRASIFYKAEFCDRVAHIRASPRFRITLDFERERRDNMAIGVVFDGEEVIFATEPTRLPSEHNTQFFEIGDNAKRLTKDWLAERYPDWENPAAYWD